MPGEETFIWMQTGPVLTSAAFGELQRSRDQVLLSRRPIISKAITRLAICTVIYKQSGKICLESYIPAPASGIR
jgi:hypothetical protein